LNHRLRNFGGERFSVFLLPVKRAEQRWHGPKRPMHTALPNVFEAFGQALFDKRFRGADHAVTMRHSRLTSMCGVIG